MAGLSPGEDAGCARGRHGPDADRAQMFLVVAVAMAALLVGLAVILNGALYAGNITARDDGVDDGSALDYRSTVVEEVGTLVTYANRYNNSNYGELRSTTKANVDAWSALATRNAAASASGANVSVESTSNGTLVDQRNATREFTNDTDAASWEPVPDTSSVRGFQLNVSRSALVDPGTNDSTASDLVNESVFAVELDDGTDSWRVFVYQDSADGEVVVKVENSTGLSAACAANAGSNGYVVVDVSNATVGGQACPQLDVLEEPAGSFDVRFERGTNAAGTYGLVTEQKISTVDDGDFSAAGGPSARYALYSVTVDLTYVTPSLRYETTVRVVPGERDG